MSIVFYDVAMSLVTIWMETSKSEFYQYALLQKRIEKRHILNLDA